jgi:hypothetical protein
MKVNKFDFREYSSVKFAYTTSNVNLNQIQTILQGDLKPNVGDLVLAKVKDIGVHKNIELSTGRKSSLFVGDEIVVCYGNRYAPDYFEAKIPEDLSACHLVAGGGVAATVISQHERLMEPPTKIIPIGLLGDEQGRRINLKQFSSTKKFFSADKPKAKTVAVFGTSMNSGKTTTAAYFIKGLVNAGFKVGAAKITGTGSGKDIWLMRDAGANPVLDFTYAGFPSTYLVQATEIERIFDVIYSNLLAQEVDMIVLEIADGLFQQETANLLASSTFQDHVDGLLFASNSALGVFGGLQYLNQYPIPVLALSGLFTASPLAIQEVKHITNTPVFDLEMLTKKSASLVSKIKSFAPSTSEIINDDRRKLVLSK